MHYLCKKLPWMWISKVCTWIKPKVSVPWHWNSVNEATMLLPKDVSNFNYIKYVFISVFITWLWIVPLPPMELWNTMATSLDILRRDFLPPKISTWTFTSNITHVPTRNLRQQQILGLCTFAQAWYLEFALLKETEYSLLVFAKTENLKLKLTTTAF